MKKIILIYGLIGGAIITIFLMSTMSTWTEDMHLEYGELIGYTGMALSLSTIFFGIISYRKKHGGGKIKFGTAFGLGLAITSVACLLYTITWMSYVIFIEPDVWARMGEAYVQQAIDSGATEVEIDAMKTQMKQYEEWTSNRLLLFLITFMEMFPVGLIISLIAALILKKK